MGRANPSPPSVAYRISDGRYESANTATLTVTVNGVNDAPLTVADTGATTQNAVLTVAAAQGILANDADPEGDTLTVSRIFNYAEARFDAVPAGGSLTLPGGNGGSFTISADGAYSFDPGTDFNDLAATKTRQSAMFYYAVDANGAEAAAHRFLRVTVTGANDAPTPVDDVARSLENSKITVPDGDKGVTSIRSGVKTVRNADLLLNDTDPDTGDTATPHHQRRRHQRHQPGRRQSGQRHRRQQRRHLHHQRHRRLETSTRAPPLTTWAPAPPAPPRWCTPSPMSPAPPIPPPSPSPSPASRTRR